MARLVLITGPIASGKSTVAALLAARLTSEGSTVVLLDVDDVAGMVAHPGAGAAGLWSAAHLAHGALVGQWMRSEVDVVLAIGPIYTPAETAALLDPLPPGTRPLRVVLDATLAVALRRVTGDPSRGLSREPAFLASTHARFRAAQPDLAADAVFDSDALDAATIATSILEAVRSMP